MGVSLAPRVVRSISYWKLGGALWQSSWDDAMLRARGQAEAYAKALPELPPFLAVIDVGHVIELFADFSLTGKNYTHFPDVQSFRITLDDLAKPEQRERLGKVWTDPASLDPARISAKVTREIAERLAKLTRSLEKAGHESQSVAEFLMRCLFTMFAEDVGLLKPAGGFTELLLSFKDKPGKFAPMAESLWATMDKGGFSPILQEDVLRFNGGLFARTKALALNAEQLDLLIDAAKSDWRDVEPAIFGTLLEQALNPRERHDQGMHYTPRAYVERLVMPTIIEPLREDWDDVKGAAVDLAKRGKTDDAVKEVIAFHRKLCDTRVLDPACGSGNFLYVTMELMKRLEGEVLSLLQDLGHDQYILEIESHTVDPHQFLGIEVNPRAAVIAELVLWIGYLQWHFKTRGKTMPAQPVLKNFKNIECRDAILAWDAKDLKRDEHGKPVTRWDGVTMKKHPVTGEDVPDETARVEMYEYRVPRKADWPHAAFIVGNPPFLGTRRMRLILGDGYVEALAGVYPYVPENADYVMYWWGKAAETVSKEPGRFGLITTNSITQVMNRRTIENFQTQKPPVFIQFAIPDHPWVDHVDGAAVRIAMTVAAPGPSQGVLMEVSTDVVDEAKETITFKSTQYGEITSDLRVGVSGAGCVALRSNSEISYWGVKFYGDGFILDEVGYSKFPESEKARIRPFFSARDLTSDFRMQYAIDCDGLSVEELRTKYPRILNHLLQYVKPVRDQNPRALKRDRWWIFGENQPGMRSAVRNLKAFIVTPETAKHRVFQRFSSEYVAEGTVCVVALEDFFSLGVLSSRIHRVWSLATGARLEDRPRYTKTQCFDKFPFPACSNDQRLRGQSLGEQLHKHRRDRQALHSDLTITGMYNVLEKLRSGEALNDKEKDTHEKGLVSVLKQIHDDLDAAVFDAYGWPSTLTDDEILARLVALNHERAEEERRGLIRWLRPEYQAPQSAPKAEIQAELDVTAAPAAKGKAAKKAPWPTALPEQFQAVRAMLAGTLKPVSAQDVASSFSRAKADRIAEVLAALAAIGKARVVEGQRYAA